MKKILSLLAACTMFVCGAVTAFADELIPNEYYTTNTVPEERQKLLLVDDADILSDSEEEKLLRKLEDISAQHGMDVCILTTYSLGDRGPEQFADDYYAYNGMGQGSDKDGLLFMLAMEDRDWAIATHGDGIEAFTDYGQEYIMSRIKPELKDDDYYSAFDEYTDLCDDFLTEYEKGTPYDTDHKIKGKLPLVWIPIALGGGLLIGLIYAQAIKGQLTSVAMQHGADDYIRQNSFKVTTSRDNFLYRNVQREYIPPAEKSSGGGSSTHSHSSGSSFGGSHGKF
ncbi:TPM domain-containing protein [Ruminococcus sp.]|uniref:TPM domain-containing protein n=1 Tax=Ruminococcus sp. TaxID=41978 RepID=UPI0025CF971F|nr:TPM domain-containing protein [Ruminococcus sp.]MBQ8966132.1 TPM domain-containing protein [Ruminococcus sp.]